MLRPRCTRAAAIAGAPWNGWTQHGYHSCCGRCGGGPHLHIAGWLASDRVHTTKGAMQQLGVQSSAFCLSIKTGCFLGFLHPKFALTIARNRLKTAQVVGP